MSVIYCAIPHFSTAVAQRDEPSLGEKPLILIGPEGRVLGVSGEAAACGIVAGMTARMAEIRCPAARLVETDMARHRAAAETLLQLLEQVSARVEPHGWGAAYVDLGDGSAGRSRRGLARGYSDAVSLCREIGQSVRRKLGETLQPALGWDSNKFTAQAAVWRIPPGHFRAVDVAREQRFLQPLPISLLPLAPDSLQRLCFLGLRSLGQYAALPPTAVWQQFGRAGKLAQRCARGEDDRPVVPRWQAPLLEAQADLEAPVVEQGRLRTEWTRLLAPLLADLRGNLQACGQVRLVIHFDDGSTQERERSFLIPVSAEESLLQALEQLAAGMQWPAAATGLTVALGQIQDAIPEQGTLFPLQDGREAKLGEVQRYLASRFGANRLRRSLLAQPGAPLAEWRTAWLDEGTP
jgi:nucleotidyltransferase/DNA polymerase involved in DNA repair